MNHLLMFPLVLPLATAVLNLLLGKRGLGIQRVLSLFGVTALFIVCLTLFFQAATGTIQLYQLGNWPPPFGIVLVLDQLSAYFLLTAAVLSFPVLLYAMAGTDEQSSFFHVLYPLQIFGICGAFLTGDLFNLFVFIEVLIIAPHCLALYGGGAARIRAGQHYILLNLAGSALFLIVLALLYGLVGTLNMADLAQRIGRSAGSQMPLLTSCLFLLLVVFGLKSALLPLSFWLPGLYSSISAPVAALFAVMTKVGVYAIIRTLTLIFAGFAAPIAHAAGEILTILALATMVVGSIGVLGATRFKNMVAYLVLVSVGMVLVGVGQGNPQALAAVLFYLPHSTWISAGLFLLAELIVQQRGGVDRFAIITGPPLQRGLLGVLFFISAVAIVGLPPLSGFLGKLLLLQAMANEHRYVLWGMVLGSGLACLLALSRAGCFLFWRTEQSAPLGQPVKKLQLLAVVLLLSTTVALSIFAEPVQQYSNALASHLYEYQRYIGAILPQGSQL